MSDLEYISYKKPPILECVFEIKFSKPIELATENLINFQEAIKENYPEKKEIITFAWNLNLDAKQPESKSIAQQNLKGYRFLSSDGNDIIHIDHDTFAFIRVKPYKGWDDVYPKFISGLKHLLAHFTELKPRRMGLRYINQWPIQADQPRLFLKITPVINSGKLPFMVSKAASNFSLVNLQHNLSGELKLQILPKKSDTDLKLEVTFDIFVFKELNGDLKLSNELESQFKNMRDFKNDIFESNIEKKSRELFNQD